MSYISQCVINIFQSNINGEYDRYYYLYIHIAKDKWKVTTIIGKVIYWLARCFIIQHT